MVLPYWLYSHDLSGFATRNLAIGALHKYPSVHLCNFRLHMSTTLHLSLLWKNYNSPILLDFVKQRSCLHKFFVETMCFHPGKKIFVGIRF